MRAAGHLEVFQSRTGLVLDPYFSGTKVAWLLREKPELRSAAEKGSLRFGTMDTWLVWRLSGGKTHVSDVSNASRTLMFDIHKRQWDEELCSLLGDIPMGILPEVKSSSEVYGHTQGLDFLPDGIPIAGMAGDQQAALFGQACFTPGMAKCTYGTGAFALMNTGTVAKKSENGLLTTIAWQLGDEVFYALEGSTFIAGAVVQWLRDGLEFFKDSPEVEALAKSVEDTGGVVLVPALTGLGAPHWRPDARGLISGITRGTNRGHIARAALEGIAFQVAELLEAMAKDSGQNLSLLRVDGGASANELLMQFQADLLGIETHRPTILESTALGAAFLAGLGVGLFSDTQAVNESWSLDRTFSREMSQENVDRKMQEWRNAVGLA
ncbi:MAG: glycerol kinase [Myxococcales bacterium]|nr:glycerol kinase [Myxococcales bacterium]